MYFQSSHFKMLIAELERNSEDSKDDQSRSQHPFEEDLNRYKYFTIKGDIYIGQEWQEECE